MTETKPEPVCAECGHAENEHSKTKTYDREGYQTSGRMCLHIPCHCEEFRPAAPKVEPPKLTIDERLDRMEKINKLLAHAISAHLDCDSPEEAESFLAKAQQLQERLLNEDK